MESIVIGAFLLAGWTYIVAEMGEAGRQEIRDNALSALRAIAAGAAVAMLIGYIVPDVTRGAMFWTGLIVAFGVYVISSFDLMHERQARAKRMAKAAESQDKRA